MELETAPTPHEGPTAPLAAEGTVDAPSAGSEAAGPAAPPPSVSSDVVPSVAAPAAVEEGQGEGEGPGEAERPDSARFLETLKRRLETASSGDGHGDIARKSKRNKLLIPSDREAYYAVLSLLVDRAGVPPDTRLSAANCEGFVPPEDLLLLEVLQKVLRYDCE